MRFLFFFLALTAVVLVLCQCNKSGSNDNGVLVGKYHNITGPCKFVFDAFGQYWEADGIDTASFSLERPVSKDSSGFLYLHGVAAFDSPNNGPYLHFVPDGIRIVAQISDTTLTIARQMPYEGSGMSIEGTGSYVHKKITLQYQTSYRGYHKYATVSGLP